MIHLRLHTEFHFDFADRAYGRLAAVVARVKSFGDSAAAITDATTFGHVSWVTECTKAGIKPILGADVRVAINDAGALARVSLLARNAAGLEELYALTSLAASEELDAATLFRSSGDVLKLSGTLLADPPKKAAGWYADVNPGMPPEIIERKRAGKLPLVVTAENRYPAIEDKPAFSLFGGAVETYPQHIFPEREARVYLKGIPDAAFALSEKIAAMCNVKLPIAKNMSVKGDLEKLCREGIPARGVRWTKVYEERLRRELRMIREKEFESYFLLISDMVRYAKAHMVVGPARGSAAGSLVCYLTYITDIDPIPHGLLFERFIDITRADLPDIDLDFPDVKRELVFAYLQKKYGAANVVHLGTTLTLQPRSILKLVSKKLDIKMYEFQPLLDVMIERSSGDSRAALCLLDTLESMDAGRAILQRFPQVRTATSFEGHANAAGTHAGGIIVASAPVRKYCTVNAETSTAQMDKSDAEKLNLVKIDVLGLRTLSVLEHVRELLLKRKRKLDFATIPLDDKAAFALINAGRWAGIFQFEGDAVQMLTRQMRVSAFSDIVALGALARPGPLNSGGATRWADRRMGREPITYLHKVVEPYTSDTYGIVIYQEQVMSIGREVGALDWEDINQLRRAMSKSKGEEFFNQYWVRFLAGATAKHKLKEREARHIWDHLNTMGSWSFNKSHAVSYGLISYWCAYLKAHYPIEFAAATLRHAKDEPQTIQLLRELTEEGMEYSAFDINRSRENWEVIDGRLIGGFLNLRGVGEITARELVEARGKWTPAQRAKIEAAEVLYSDIFPTRARFGALYDDPRANGLPGVRKLWTAREIDAAKASDSLPEEFFFLGRLADKVPRSLNEYVFQIKRAQEGKPKLVPEAEANYLNVVFEDDTGRVWLTVNWRSYEELGKPIVDNGVVGKSWYVVGARLNQIKRLNATWIKDITNDAYRPSKTSQPTGGADAPRRSDQAGRRTLPAARGGAAQRTLPFE